MFPATERSPSFTSLAIESTAGGGVVLPFETRERGPALIDPDAEARWCDLTMYPMNGETIGVALHGGKPRHFHALELGMAHRVTRNPTVAFELLLHLCESRGRTDWRSARFSEDAPIAFDNFAAFKMQAYALRRILKERFGIAGEPYVSLGKRKELVTAFRALPAAPGEMRYLPKAM